ncbi:VC_2705 family sodium/solute symporter [Limnohabitans sp. JUR4]|uniref:VC_2705 family sodium/solute symporter n=2 Tax=Limnohabitans radicicola TaxID=2771427 RepID=A0A927IMC5_9BURK|nr:VC_2705 family sodium/solute symporter [Limnohabitans radicicola]MBD8050857.1 VC_2705 family sodium/solute symporter [Limnohabitans radicicola]
MGQRSDSGIPRSYRWRLHRNVLLFIALFLCLLGAMAWAEHSGLSRNLIGPIFLFSTVMIYALIGISGRTTDPDEYFVAGRRVPAMYNGMATAADWMSAASFISLAGALYLQGFSGTGNQPGGLAYVMGWTGGFCLVALLIAPSLRAMQLYTLPDFFHVRYGGRWPRLLAAWAAILCSFTYVVAQIYGIGLIASRLTGVQFEIGILLGLGGVLLCSFLGGMRAITWTQVAQYIVLLFAFLIPVSWLAYKQLGTPFAPLAYGSQLARIEALETRLMNDPAELEVRQAHLERAEMYRTRLLDVEQSLLDLRAQLEQRVRTLKAQGADFASIAQARRELLAMPPNAAVAREQWQRAQADNLERSKPLGGMVPHAREFRGDPAGAAADRQLFETSQLNFLALVFCLMVGTAGLPHLLTRYYTTPSVAEARTSVAWSLFFIALLYLSAPALAVLVKFELMNSLVGSSFEQLPSWIAQWARIDPALVEVADINGDRILQWGELKLGADIIMLATPELGGMPFVVSGLVAAGGLAAALSTADGLLLTISNALVHDMGSSRQYTPRSAEGRVILSKFALLAVAMLAAFVAALKPAQILSLVSASFSLAAAAFFPAMVLGLRSARIGRSAAVAGMLAGWGLTTYYMVVNGAAFRQFWGLAPDSGLWFGIQPLSSGVFGVPAGFVTIWLWSWLWPEKPSPVLGSSADRSSSHYPGL